MVYLEREFSDHCPILLDTDGAVKRTKRPFRFVEAWVSDRSSFKVVENAWHADWKDGMESHQLRMSLFNTSKALTKWNKDHFGFAHTKLNSWKKI